MITQKPNLQIHIVPTDAQFYYYVYSLLTPWSRVLLQKLTGLQLVKKFPAFYGIRRFITALTSSRHLSLSWASSIQSTHPHRTSRRSILILSSHTIMYGRPLACWDRGFESHLGHGYLSVVSVVRCQVEVSATNWSLVQRSPTDCGASLCVI